MKKLLFRICYQGAQYHGWQVQKNGISVQERFQDALEGLLKKRNPICGCSRTDAGVHAREYFFHMVTDSPISEAQMKIALNRSFLPRDIAVLDIVPVPMSFHARYSAVGKEYCYQIWNAEYPSPFLKDMSWWYRPKLSVDAMREGIPYLLGRKDFSSFCAAGSSVINHHRELFEIAVERFDELIQLRFRGDGFLYHMVRILVGTFVAISEGRLQSVDLPRILEACDRSLAGATAPPEGLFLNRVFYSQKEWGRNNEGTESVGEY